VRFKVRSLKTRLILSSVAAIAITGFAATYVGIYLIANKIGEEMQDRVRLDLNTAREIYNAEIGRIFNAVRMTAERFFVQNALLQGENNILREELERVRKRENLDILTLTDAKGQVILRSNNPHASGDSQARDELIGRVILERKPVVSTWIIPEEELEKEGRELAERANIRYVPTPKAMPAYKTGETSGMMMKAAAPVLDNGRNLIGILYGGKLLNRDYSIVDKIKETVFQGMQYEGKDIGTATVFQDDLRIATNVLDKDGKRAIGTRIAEDVYQQVLLKGKQWTARAFVVNDWFITAYEPIRNVNGKIIGVLYVGIVEKTFVGLKKKYTAMFLGISLTGILAGVGISYLLSNRILQPIRNVVSGAKRLAEGDFKYRVKVDGDDEIGNLAETFNFMASSLEERDERIRKYTQQQIMKSEKMALLGQLSAGVAHEINNPLGAMLIYSSLLLEDTKPDDPRRENLEKIVKEANRCKEIVRGLLDFSRQKELNLESLDINGIIGKTLSLIEKQTLFHDIKIIKGFDLSRPRIKADEGQIQQVFLNIILNAAEAMDGKGRLTITTRYLLGDNFAEIRFSDTGCGISKENLAKIFEPFFTTKEDKKKIGLGLAISSRIIEEHGGRIEVESELGKGTTFIIRLPGKTPEAGGPIGYEI
jgi:two-component system NtrC family sensor kinase